MLVLTRKPGEKITVGTDIVITVVRISDNKVRIGLEAPKHINVVRNELIEPFIEPLITRLP